MVKGGKNGVNGGSSALHAAGLPSPSTSPQPVAATATAAPLQQHLPPFLNKCYDMVDDPSTNPTVSWSSAGNSFVLWDPLAFVRDLLPKYFKHGNLSSFVRQLNTYGFHKVDPDRWEFANEGFLRGQKNLLKTIVRRKPAQHTVQSAPPQREHSALVQTCVEVGKFGFEEEIESLKRDKAVLMQELVKLRQHQQNSDNELHCVRDRIQVMEQQQQQMLSFLAMAVQNPGFLPQLVQQNGNNWWRVEANKKRRLPAPEQGAHSFEQSPKGQMVKYQAVMTGNFEPFLPPTSNSDVSPELGQLSNGIDDLSINRKDTSFEVDPFYPTGEGSHANIPDDEDVDLDWFQLLASPTPENNQEIYPHNLGFSDFGMDFELPEHEIHLEAPQNLGLPNEHVAVESPTLNNGNKY
uniref:Heat stress transcription factor A-1b n=2 Tax=Anthurium amnicola TaxID=1678845 RepID=A0A1D1ZAG9_9ARAE